MTKLEIIELKALKELVLEKFKNNDETLDWILKQTSTTNGHVADAFERISCLQRKYEFARGGIAVIMAVIIPVFFLLVKTYLDRQ